VTYEHIVVVLFLVFLVGIHLPHDRDPFDPTDGRGV